MGGGWVLDFARLKLTQPSLAGAGAELGKKKKSKRRKEKIMLFLVATNLVASRPPERRPTGTPHARANYKIKTSY